MKAGAVQLQEIECGGLTFQIFGIAGADAPGIGLEPIHAFATGKAQTGGLVLDFAPDDIGPGLLGQRTSNVEL